MIAKSSRLQRDVEKYNHRIEAKAAKDLAKRQTAKLRSALSALVKLRDKGCCRVCNVPTVRHGHPALIGAAHHIVYRSAGGKDELSNLIWTCAKCHDDEHHHEIVITGTAGTLRIEVNESVAIARAQA